MAARRPKTKTIEQVFKWLEDHDLRVYGPNIDIGNRNIYPACRDFNAKEAIEACRLMDKDLLTERDDL